MKGAVAFILGVLFLSAVSPATVLCPGHGLAADEFSNRWPPKKEYENPGITQAMEAVREAIPKAQKDPTRPVYHFRPAARWMNDPCGAVYHKGYYHVFYQLNPTGDSDWGRDNSHWGHTRSKDLARWEHLPVALCPSRELGERRCNSGCAVINGKGQPMIFYTYVPLKGGVSRQQWAAIGDDDLITWKKHPDNPIIGREKAGVPPPPAVSLGWSDPFVFRAGGRTFVTFKASGGAVCEALNEELTRWKYVKSVAGVHGECPNVVKLGEKWLLITSGGASSKQLHYQVGHFDPQQLKFTVEKTGILDHSYGPEWPKPTATIPISRGFYATNTLFDPQGRCVLFGWVSGFQGGRGWNGCLGLPRILTLGPDGRPRQTPVPQLQALRREHRRVEGVVLKDRGQVLEAARGDTLEILAKLEPGDAKACGLKVRRSKDGTAAVTLRYDGKTLDAAGTKLPLQLDDDQPTLTLHVFLDRSVMEVFAGGGRECITRVIYPGEDDLGTEVFAEGGTARLESVDVWKMKSIW